MSISCSICFIPFDTDEDVISLSTCGHVYHNSCLTTWSKISKQQSCPLCRKGYKRNSLKRLYFNIEESEVAAQLNNELKQQKLDNEKLETKVKQNQIELERYKNTWSSIMEKYNQMKAEYGIKCQAYNIIDTVNNEYLLNNTHLKNENESLRQEAVKLRNELDELKKVNLKLKVKQNCKVVDLTNDDDDGGIEIIDDQKENEIIEINDDEAEEEENENETLLKIKTQNSDEDDESDDLLKSVNSIDYTNFEDFLLSQI